MIVHVSLFQPATVCQDLPESPVYEEYLVTPENAAHMGLLDYPDHQV